jgi:hypothetical protein
MHLDNIAKSTPQNILDLDQEIIKHNPEEALIEHNNSIEEEDNKSEIKIVFNEEDENQVDADKDHPKEQPFDQIIKTPSGRVSRPVHKFVTQHQSHLQTQATDPQKYSIKTGKVIAKTINKLNQAKPPICSNLQPK